MASSNEYTEGYGRIDPKLTDRWNQNIILNLDNNKYIIHQFEITDENTYCNSVYIDNYSNYYIQHITRNAGPYQCTSYGNLGLLIKNDNTKYKLSNKLIDNIKKIKYYPTGGGGHPNSSADNIYFDVLDIIKNIIVAQSEKITKKYIFKYQSLESSDVYIAGTFNNWEKIKMTNDNNIWKYDMDLDEGTYEYKFIINDEWKYDDKQPIITNNGIINNIVIL